MEYTAKFVDICVVGAGHAGIEAALAGARLGCNTILFSLNLDSVGNMPCNPSIGGTGKGHLVFEIDALGGEMGRAADKACLQSRILNSGKGPAVHSLRMQQDRRKYQSIMKTTLENCENLSLIQAEIVDIRKNGELWECVTRLGAVYSCKCCIISSGTYLDSRVIVGEAAYPSGPDGMFPSSFLSQSLARLGVSLMRFKTGTPPRIHADTVDYSKLELQEPDEDPFCFSRDTKELETSKFLPCYVAYTNSETHRIIRENLHRSPLYSGQIKGTGPRYCPSIEDKVVRFADKERHQLFLEPMGEDTKELYLQGFSSSLPEEVQQKMLRTISGFENCHVTRTAYAIEYDCADPLQLRRTLEFKEFSGLYGAGQFNGTSGYEEAAAQGLIAGINAALKIKGKEPFELTRDSSYIGTLIDDLITKGTNEPYRIMTSRSEYRLLLRQDNADMRLTDFGYKIGLINEERYASFVQKRENIQNEIKRCNSTYVPPSLELSEFLKEQNSAPAENGISIADLVRRPEIKYDSLSAFDKERPALSRDEAREVEIEIKYEGYIKRQIAEAQRFKKLECKKLPADIDYTKIKGIRLEAQQKLEKLRPENIGQASRISGVSPADITVLLIYLGMQ